VAFLFRTPIPLGSASPGTSEASIAYVLDRVDLILVMTVNPGFGGQAFIPGMCEKIRRIRAMIGKREIRLEVDGGIVAETARQVAAAGADVLVAGNGVFKGGPYARNIAAIRKAAEEARG
jgi:ribulose-phosphate 3-epimerase